jgi:hypothetical protein
LNSAEPASKVCAIDSETADSNSPTLHTRLVGTVDGRVRRLKGYQKSHHLPDGHHPAAQAFVRKVGHENVKEIVDQFYTDIRSLFGYKRREFHYTCEDGFGCIKTPDFDLQVRIDQCPLDAKNYQLTTEITALHHPEITNDDRFHACFTHHCETLIVEFPGSINIDEKIDAIEDIDEIAQYLTYEPDGSAFELRLIPLDLEIKVTESEMTFQLLTLRNLEKLIDHSQKAFEILTEVGLGAELG